MAVLQSHGREQSAGTERCDLLKPVKPWESVFALSHRLVSEARITFRSGSNIGSSRSGDGVTGMTAPGIVFWPSELLCWWL